MLPAGHKYFKPTTTKRNYLKEPDNFWLFKIFTKMLQLK
jgi:hypothetical protein